MFQENGYLTDQSLQERMIRLQIQGIIQPLIMRQLNDPIILKRDGDWSEIGCQSADKFDKYFKIYTGDRDRFDWVNDKLKVACKFMDYPFLRMEWDDIV